MAYTPHEWQDGELITKESLNRIEDGIEAGGLYVNVKQYGAVGDGITDDTEAITNSIKKARENFINSNETNIVVIPSGNYVISAKITLPPYVKLVTTGFSTILFKNLDAVIEVNLFDEDLENDFITNYFKQAYSRGEIINGTAGLVLKYIGTEDVTNTNNTGLRIGSLLNNGKTVARCSFKEIMITGFNYGLQITGFNNYIIDFYGMHIEANKNNVLLGLYDNSTKSVNSGENISFFGSVISSGHVNFVFNTNSFDLNLYGTSVDYSAIGFLFNHSGCNVNMEGGHVEDNIVLVDTTGMEAGAPNAPTVSFSQVRFYFYGSNEKLFVSNRSDIKSVISLDFVKFLGSYFTQVDYLADDGYYVVSNYINTGGHYITPISTFNNPVPDYDYANEKMTITSSNVGETVGYSTSVPESRYGKVINLVGTTNHSNWIKVVTPSFLVFGKNEILFKIPWYVEGNSTITNWTSTIVFYDINGIELSRTVGDLSGTSNYAINKWMFKYGVVRKIPINAYNAKIVIEYGSAFENSRKIIGPINTNIF